MAKPPFVVVDLQSLYPGYLSDNRHFLLSPMPGLIPFLPTPPLPQPTRTTSSFAPGRPVNSSLGTDQGAARGSSSQTPIELDDDSEPTSASASRNATLTQQHQQPQHQHIENLWGVLAPDNTQTQPALPSFSDFAANLDYQPFDATALPQNGAPQTPGRQSVTDEYLSALVDGNFSSPSSYPRHTQASADNQHTNLAQSPQDAPHRHPAGTPLRPDRPARYTSQNTNAAVRTAARDPTSHPAYHHNGLEESLFVSSDDEPQATMPVQTRRRASTILSSDHDPDPEEVVVPATRKRAAPSSAPTRGAAAPKRRRTSQPQTARNRTTTTPGALGPDDDIFGQDDVDTKKGKGKDEDIIDLADANEVPEDLKVPKEDKRVKISAFQCVICMDDVTALTVTHCGHLFCSECLHSALNVDATKNKCPICRQKVETKDRNDYTAKTKGFWPLELKLMTASRKGKQRA